MKLKRVSKERFSFQLSRREKQLLVEILRLYPCLPTAHLPVSKMGNLPDKQASQKLLEDALADQRSETKRQLDQLLADPQRWSEAGDTCSLFLSGPEIEWLMQVLNDIRVGSWVRLGSPERLEVIDEQTAPHLWAMEMAGFYQMSLIHALDGPV